jgi:Undecaprenyl-phosphate glucose phosphotransferase
MSELFATEVWKVRAHKRLQYRPFLQHIPYQHIGLFTAISDFTLILVASIAASVAYGFFLFETQGDARAFAFVGCYFGCYAGMLFVLWANALGLYRPKAVLSASTQVRGVVIAWGAVLLFGTSILFLLKSGANYSRGATIGFGLVSLGLLLVSRVITGANLRRALATGALPGQRVIVIGDPEELAAISARHLLRTYGAREIGRFELSPTDHTDSKIEYDMAIIDSGIRVAQDNDAEGVLLALRWINKWHRDLICERLRALPLPVFLLPDRFVSSIVSPARGGFNSELPIEVQRAPLSKGNLIAKRIFDLMLASCGLVLFALPAAVICVAIMLDSPGPVIFRQRRKGFNGREFAIYKFRTMTVLEDGPTIRQARRDDPRVTSVGRLLRAASLDEMPQLINVLKGEMSLVGPRPHAIAHDDEYSNSIEKYAFRHHVKPGISGWAQVNGFRGETADVALMNKRIQLDLWYVNNWSFWLDLWIMARTSVVVLRPRNAY